MHLIACRNPLKRKGIGKTLLIMKLTAIFLLAVCLNASANGFAQKISLSEKNVSLEKVFREIKKQTGYTFAYTKALLQKAKPVTVSISNAPIEIVLDLCFQGQPLDYTIINKTVVVVNKKEVAPQKEQVSIPTPVPIQGKITNDKGEPLRGATVTEKGTQNLTITNEDGIFSIDVTNSKSILVISFVGFESKEVVVANQTSFDIALASTQQQISEVVIVGYGTQKRKSLTGSVTSVSASAYKDQPVTNISSALQGRASGVSVSNTSGAPGGEVKIRIRGSNSITASNDPLYVVDGVALGSVGLQDINVNDIESMDILKDASATAIYGSRGANGVVIITTKSGKAGASKVEYNTFVSFNRPMKKYELLDAVVYAKLANHIAGTNVYADPESFAGKSTDWQDLIFKDGITQNHQLSLSGGTEKSRYYLSGNYVNQSGLVVNTNQKKYALRSNIDTRISNKFTAGLNFYVSHINSHNTADIGGKGNPLMSALAWGPTEPVYDDAATGQYNKSTSSPIWGNPYMTAMERVGDVRSNAAVANAKVKYTINDWLTFDFNVGADYSIAKSAYYNNEWINTNKGSGQSSTESFTIQNSNVLTAHKVFENIHDVTAMAIVEETSNKTNYFTASGSGLSTSLGSYYDLQNNSAQGISSGYSNWSLLSYVGRISYALMDKYLLTATYRTDGSSKFQKSNNKWGHFPSIGVGWRLSEEKFIKDLDLFSSLKLRAGYGVTGNQAIAPYKTLGTLQSAGYSFGTTTVSPGL
jgi:TonB-linked SusC/RagA family outer membrane protein